MAKMAMGCIVPIFVVCFISGFVSGQTADSPTSPWALILTKGTDAPQPREGHSATLINNDVYIFGGYYPARALWGRDNSPDVVFNDIWRLNMLDFSWTKLAPVGGNRSPVGGHSASEVNGVLYTFGGWNGGYSQDLYRYLPTTNSWTLVSSGIGPSPRAFATSWSDGFKFYVYGGENGQTELSDTWYYDVTASRWFLVNTNNAPPARAYANAARTPGGVMIYGGQRRPDSGKATSYLDDLHRFVDGDWETPVDETDADLNFPLPVSSGSAGYYSEGASFVVLGGLVGPWSTDIDRCGWYNPNEYRFVDYSPVDTVRVYSGVGLKWEKGSPAPYFKNRGVTARLSNSQAVHYGNNLFMFGGYGCEDISGTGLKPFPVVYGQFNQIPIYNALADTNTSVAISSGSVLRSLLGVMFSGIFAVAAFM